MQQGAYADVVVKLGLVKLLTKRFDICEELCVPSKQVHSTDQAAAADVLFLLLLLGTMQVKCQRYAPVSCPAWRIHHHTDGRLAQGDSQRCVPNPPSPRNG